jgi:hypothetical protein
MPTRSQRHRLSVQGINSKGETTSGIFFPGAVIDIDFTRGLANGTTLGALTVVRAQTGSCYAETSNRTLVPFPANTLRRTDLGVLIEEPRSNLAWNSQKFASHINGGSICVDNVALAPDNTNTAASMAADGTGVSHGSQNGSGNISFANPGMYALSVYAKAGSCNFLQIAPSSPSSFSQSPFATFNLTTGAVTQTGGTTQFVTAYSEPKTNGWWRLVGVFNSSAAVSNSTVIYHSQTGTDGRAPSYVSSATCFVWGEQCELVPVGSLLYASSYNPTDSVLLARGLDNVQLVGAPFTSLYNANTGSLYCEFMPLSSNLAGAQSRRMVELSDNTPNSRHFIAQNASNQGRYLTSVVGSVQADINQGALAIGSVNKVMAGWSAAPLFTTGEANDAVNGTLGTQDTSVTAATTVGGVNGRMFIGSESALAAPSCANAYIRRIGLWVTRQPDSYQASNTIVPSAWILQTGTWADVGIWDDANFWKDS